MKTKTLRNILLFLLAFLGMGAVFGGGILMISPYGKLLGMPLLASYFLYDAGNFHNFYGIASKG